MLSTRALLARSRALPLATSRTHCFYNTQASRPRILQPKLKPSIRKASYDAGENDTGHIITGPNEGIFFFDNIFPLNLTWLNRIPLINANKSITELMKRFNNPNVAAADPMRIIQRALPEKLPLKVTEVLPRIKEGGAFVKFTYEDGVKPADLEGTLREYMVEKPIKPWFNPFRRVRAFLVQGRPWLEDLYRLPSSRIKVEFLPTSPEAAAAELTQETLFSLFRRYGKLVEITPQPSDSKITPRYAFVDYSRIRFATMAKNCMHGFVLVEEEGGGKTGTILKLTYQSRVKARWFRDWIANHPRIVLPIVAALIAATSMTIFDPIRTFFIRIQINHGLHFEENLWYKWLRGQVIRGVDALRFSKRKAEDEGYDVLFDDRGSVIEQLQTWLMETADTFIVVQGPRGSGKKELVMNQALKDRPYKLTIDCKPIQEAHGDGATIRAAAAEVGYRPVFSWMNSFSSLIDLAAMGTIGTKTGFSETLDNQLAKIWNNTATALKQVALSSRSKDDKDNELGDDEWLEAHPEKRPVIVIDNFLHKANEGNVVYDKISEWAAGLTTGNIAHVIFLTHDVSFSKSLSKALPDRVFRQIVLGDCSPETAKKYVIRHLDLDGGRGNTEAEDAEKGVSQHQAEVDLSELDSVIKVLGGRMSDLEFLARRIKAGETPKKAVDEIVEQSASEILKMYLLDVDIEKRTWTPQQAWLLIKELAKHDVLRYNEILLSDVFNKDAETTLQALEQAELITITSSNGRPHGIKPGRPVYQAAFEFLTKDEVLSSRLDLAILTQLIGLENKSVDKYEAELRQLAELPNAPKELTPRILWLLHKAEAAHANVEKYEREAAKLKKVLREKY